jgi:hypothetical protein
MRGDAARISRQFGEKISRATRLDVAIKIESPDCATTVLATSCYTAPDSGRATRFQNSDCESRTMVVR